MIPPSAVALFCEDIREEKSGAVNLIGVLGDNVSVASPSANDSNLQAIVPKLCVYLRVNIDATAEIEPILFSVVMPDGTLAVQGQFDDATIAAAQATREQGNPVAGMVSRLIMGNFTIPKTLGRITVTATIAGQAYVAGTLNFTAPATS